MKKSRVLLYILPIIMFIGFFISFYSFFTHHGNLTFIISGAIAIFTGFFWFFLFLKINSMVNIKLDRIKIARNYLKSFWKYYLLRKPKLILTFILTIIVFIWISMILKEILSEFVSGSGNLEIVSLGSLPGGGWCLLFIKPIFTYIAGLIIIKHI